MDSYGRLAGCYDIFTEDVNYPAWADYFENIFKRFDTEVHSVLDLACGTGSLSTLLAQRGYEVIGVDASYDMLAIANEKSYEITENRPLFLCQKMEELDLYGTVDAALCCLDSFNYLQSAEAFDAALSRLRYFVRPGGMLVFDLNTAHKFKDMDGQLFLRENDDHLCIWSASFDENNGICRMVMDLFDRCGELWERSGEEHIERVHSDCEVVSSLERNGFELLARFDELRFNPATDSSNRIFYVARKRNV